MLLAVDVGNTDTTIGVLDRAKIVETWRMATNAARTPDELALMFASFLGLKGLHFDRNVSGVAVASVVPRITQAMREMVPRYFNFEPFVVEPGIRTGMPVLIDNPKEVGADRICDAVASYAEYGGPCIVVDLGTATTFDAVSEAGEYLGGAIAPGLGISAEALFSFAAQLRRVEFLPPRTPIGKSTVEATQSGLLLGYGSLIEGMIDRFRKELGGDAKTVVTGGLAEVILDLVSGLDHHEPWLTLKGLRILFDRNTA
jgi:type III pantothenate kinase